MPWVVGIDEAGYGPNLGPLVQAAVAVRLPDADPGGWDTLKGHVRRAADGKDKRVLIDDSKQVHAGVHGLKKLEHGLFAAVGPHAGPLGDWVRAVGLPWTCDDLAGEAWYDPTEPLPLFPPGTDLRSDLDRLGIAVKVVAANVVPTPLFNKVVAGSGSKATVLSAGLVELLKATDRGLPAGEPVHVVADQLGGRRFYAAALQAGFPAGWPVTEAEDGDASRYRVEGLGRAVRAEFRPRADGGCVAVALASMLCKYAREVCMRQFNRYWATRVPGLKPTAGYPGDAGRFLEAIRPAMAALGVAEDAVWRCR